MRVVPHPVGQMPLGACRSPAPAFLLVRRLLYCQNGACARCRVLTGDELQQAHGRGLTPTAGRKEDTSMKHRSFKASSATPASTTAMSAWR